MKEITLKIPNAKIDFFISLLKELGIEYTEQQSIPIEYQKIVLDRIKNTKEEDLLNWDQAKNDFQLD